MSEMNEVKEKMPSELYRLVEKRFHELLSETDGFSSMEDQLKVGYISGKIALFVYDYTNIKNKSRPS